MKKVRRFLGSMKFGMLLLALIAVLSVFGTVIPQDQAAEAYEAAYGGAAKLILLLGLNHLYSTWYYAGLYVLLGISLLLCSILRIGRVGRTGNALIAAADREKALEEVSFSDPETALKKNGFKKTGNGWLKNRAGLYGSFVTHLALLVMLAACACVFMLQEKTDYSIPVGQTITLEDGTMLHVDDFSVEEDGKVEYRADLTAVLPDETVVSGSVRVNHPRYFGRYKIYQQSYDYMGQVDIRTSGDGEDERAQLDSSAFLTLDGENGISYMGSFGSFVCTEDGQILPEGYPGAAGESVEGYLIAVLDHGSQEMKLAKIDETIEVAGVYYTFRFPQAYPGLRAKTLPSFVLPLLYASFGILVIGLYLCFFCVPAAAVVRNGMVAVRSKGDGRQIERMIRQTNENMAGKNTEEII